MIDVDQSSQVGERWVLSAEGDNPAGPLFAGGEYAAADIVGSATRSTACSACSGSHTASCC